MVEPGSGRPGPDGIPQLPRTPSGRIPQWMIDEALGLPPAQPSPWRAEVPNPWDPAGGPGHDPLRPERSRRRHRRRRRWMRALSLLTFVALVGGMTAWTMWSNSSPSPPPSVAAADRHDHTGSWTTFTGGPTPGVGSHDSPLGTPAPLDRRSDSYRFVSDGRHDGQVTAYDPCRAIHYVTNSALAPEGWQDRLTSAIDRVSEATGLHFVYDGETEEAPSSTRTPFQPDRYGDRWAPVLVAWTTPEANPGLAGNVAGLGGSIAITMTGRSPVYVTGQIELDAPQLARGLGRSGADEMVRAVIEHELGHLVGLDHVDDPTQLMNPYMVPGHTDYAAGDLTGLSILGRGRCAPEL